MATRRVLVLAVSLILATSGCRWIVRASVDSAGNQANGESSGPVLSGDGRLVAFTSDASNLVPDDTNGASDAFVRDNRTGQTERVSVGPAGEQLGGTRLAGISDNGRYVAFNGSSSTGCTFGDLMIRDRHRETTECVDNASYFATGTPGALSATGRFVVAYAADSVVLVDRDTGERELIGRPTGYNEWGRETLAISDDGRYVAFGALKPPFCTPSGTCLPRLGDAFVYDRLTGIYEPMPLPANDSNRIPIRGTSPSMSGDGRWVTYLMVEAPASNPLDDVGRSVWVHDRQTGTTEPVNVSPDGALGFESGSPPDISDDGRFVAFGDDPGDPGLDPAFPSDRGLYVRDLLDGRTTLVTRGANLGGIGNISLSDDGRYVAFDSWSADLVANDTNGVKDIFVRAYPTPVVRSVDPALVPHGTSTKMTVTGDGFAPSPKVNVSGAGVSVTSVKQVSEHELRVSIVVDPGAATGARSVIVTNTGTGPGPAAGDTGACSACLTIT
jgi:hypothetical protein